MQIPIQYRPLPVWPHPPAENERGWPFKATWAQTLDLLRFEVGQVMDESKVYSQGLPTILIGLGLREQDIRLDGQFRANIGRSNFAHQGVEISFDSRYGRLTYATDTCADWQQNVRSIALGLQALRAVDRYGVGRRGQQYAGYRALTSGSGDPTTASEAWEVLSLASGIKLVDVERRRAVMESMYRLAAKKTHPDQGGTAHAFQRVEAARRFLEAIVH